MRLILVTVLLAIQSLGAAVWHVDLKATGDGSGTAPEHAWTSLGSINWQALSPGDIVRVADGDYPERLIIRKSGSSTDRRILFVGDSGRPRILGVTSGGHDYIAIVNFEITHGTAGQGAAGVILNNADGWLVQDNYIHSVDGGGVLCAYNTVNNYNIIRGNRFDNLGIVPGSTTLRTGVVIFGHYNLVEYNFFGKGEDRTRLHGGHNIVRNNYFGPMRQGDLLGTDPHVDDLQSFPTTLQFHNNLFEYNFSENNTTANGHWIIVRDIQNAGLRGLIARHNVTVRNGSVLAIFEGFSDAWVYNNTFVDAQEAYSGGTKNRYCVVLTGTSPNHHWVNNSFIRSSRDDGLDAILVGPFALPSFFSANNHVFKTGILSIGLDHLVNVNPGFVDETSDDFRLSSSSPLRKAAAPLTTATDAGSNDTKLRVRDSGYFYDGWGITHGDEIVIGDSTPVTIKAIDHAGDLITLTGPRTWSSGAAVRLAHMDSVGAYGSTVPPAVLVVNTTAEFDTGIVRLSAELDHTNWIRFVQFIVDGVPVGEDYTPPYRMEWDALTDIKVVEARAYVRHASKRLWWSDSRSPDIPRTPQSPSRLEVQPAN